MFCAFLTLNRFRVTIFKLGSNKKKAIFSYETWLGCNQYCDVFKFVESIAVGLNTTQNR